MPDATRGLRQLPQVRPARPGEYKAIGSLIAATFVAEGWASSRQAPALQQTSARAERATVLVAVDGDQLLGTVTLSFPQSRSEPAIDTPAVSWLVVAPHARGRGVGRALVIACVRRARLFGFRNIKLSVAEDMTSARGLFERLAFVLTPRDEPSDRRRRPPQLMYERHLHQAVHPARSGAT